MSLPADLVETALNCGPARSNASAFNGSCDDHKIPSTPFDLLKISSRVGSGWPSQMITSHLSINV